MRTLACLWIAWCCLHSLLISDTAHRAAGRLGNLAKRSYRLGYILFSALSLAPILWLQYNLPARLFFDWSGPWRLAQASLLLYAATLFYLGTQRYDIPYFLGIRQLREQEPDPAPPFRRGGILNRVRHPWYSGGLALLWASGPISDVTLISHSVLSIYLLIGTLLEERRLLHRIGEPYRRYQQEVPMLLPWKW